MSFPNGYDAFKQAILGKLNDAITDLGSFPTTEALTAATNIVFGSLPQIEVHYQQSVDARKEAEKDRQETVRLRSELESARQQMLRDRTLQEDQHRAQVQ
jgi:hypothetical protein